MSAEVLSHKTSWLDGKECDDCAEIFNKTVEFKFLGSYLNMCTCCFNKFKKGFTDE